MELKRNIGILYTKYGGILYTKYGVLYTKYGVEKKPRKPTRKTQSEEKIISDTKNFFEQEEDDYYQPVTEGNFYSNILWQYFILNMNVVLEIDPITQEYLNEITPYL